MTVRPASVQPALRLVHADVAAAEQVLTSRHAAERGRASRRDVAAENAAASAMSPLDARWVFAASVAREIELSGAPGAGVLSPERRKTLSRLATRLGLRAFDANLVIAIVQDGCRSGEGALSARIGERLTLVRGREDRPVMTVREFAAWLLASACMAITIGLALARWISG
jgi:hypothetical protein